MRIYISTTYLSISLILPFLDKKVKNSMQKYDLISYMIWILFFIYKLKKGCFFNLVSI